VTAAPHIGESGPRILQCCSYHNVICLDVVHECGVFASCHSCVGCGCCRLHCRGGTGIVGGHSLSCLAPEVTETDSECISVQVVFRSPASGSFWL
jgi:hypothetical protein